jgi:catechol 2,3-dioxygenase-like lactoylglutathione lyase family enzyme
LPFVATAVDDRPSPVPIDHVNIPVADLAVSRDFYSAALAPLGFRLVYEGEESLSFGRGDDGDDDEPVALRLGDPPGRASHNVYKGGT